MRRSAIGATLVIAVVAWTGNVLACNVPVFRYALERWNKRNAEEQYSLYVFHEGSLPETLRKELDELDNRLEDAAQPANLMTYRVDTAKEVADPAIAKLWQR